MTTITVDQFAVASTQWARLRNGQFARNWPVKGGWEGWVQVDLTAHIIAADSRIDILREQPVYANNRQRCDLLLNADEVPADQIPVEIKAESFDNRGRFINGVEEDLDKFDGRDGAYLNSTCVMLAIPFSQGGYDELLALQRGGHRIFHSIFIGEVACVMAVWMPGRGWLSPTQVPAAEATGKLARPESP
ncbi:hypothetical protein Athai_49770 [Actinocatenispora thailandica]|uniref:Uncharacterized protein n=1 Tax=Actinocatenispora thailandica TaxID=227318 RepID=A0A7R7HZL5_9ACTN|nr:hypothetical protein [Actinocatenispora thailandica]BCJ37474.1 hypothetical protein Athai_49770 [Actinocatenispora thailandica]